MSKILLIAQNTYREAIRDKVLHNVVFLALALLLFSIVLGDWSVFDRSGVIKSFGLTISSLSALLLAVFVGIQLLQKEMQRRTLFALLSKPVRRTEFILGKWIGLMLILATHLLLMMSAIELILWFVDGDPGWNMMQAALMIWFEMAILSSAALLFSTFSTPTLSSLFTIGVYIAGHLVVELEGHIAFTKGMGSFERMPLSVQWITEKGVGVLNLFFPDLDRFSMTATILHGNSAGLHYASLIEVGQSFLYSCCWTALLLGIASMWFSKRDFI